MLTSSVRSGSICASKIRYAGLGCLHVCHRRSLHTTGRRLQSRAEEEDIDEILSKPTWSVQALLPTDKQIDETTDVSNEQLHHLLRLCALPEPKSSEDEQKMLRDLKAQLHFVRQVQSVDTTGVTPLRSIRDESEEANKEVEITVSSLKDAFDREEIVGLHHKRIKIRRNAPAPDRSAEQWDILGQAPRKAGRYFKVEVPSE